MKSGNKKINLYIVNANYPFGKTETFLENEIRFISAHFDKIYLFPLNYPSKDFTVRSVPENVIYMPPLLDKLHSKRIIYFFFKLSPINHFLKDLSNLFKSGNGGYLHKLKNWLIALLVDRSFYNSTQYNYIKNNINPEDILYFYWGGGRSRLAKEFNHPNTFIRIHGRELDMERNNNYITLFESNFTIKATFLAISNKVKTQLLAKFPKNNVKVNRLGTFDHGLNTEIYSSKTIRIVSCSNVIPLKRVHLIIMALKEIKDIEVEWIHFGDGILLDQLRTLASELPLNIKYNFKGRVSNEKVLDFYKENYVNLFINISTAEGVPVSIMEAFSFGIPCFATDVGATSELVNDANGVLVQKDFLISKLTKCIITSNNDQFKIKRTNARKTWEKYCNAENNYLELVKTMVNY